MKAKGPRMEQETILIVGGDDATREEITKALDHSGHLSDHVRDAAAALRYLQVRPDCRLVLTALELPATNGISLLDSISHQFPAVPVILFSWRKTIRSVLDALRHGAFDFLPLPCDRSFLASTVDAALEHGRMRRQSLLYHRQLEELITERTRKLHATMSSLERSYDITLEAMGDALDLRDAETQGHSRRVTAYAVALARAMHLTPAELKVVARGAFLHDIGKIAVPDAILRKPGKLTPEETRVMQQHCRHGYDIVRKIPFLEEAAGIVHAHHEAFDGSGYPGGLCGSEIPLGARIFSVADTLDAMTSDRPYRKSTSFPEALAEIEFRRGTQFDPAIVDVFLSLPIDTWTLLRGATTYAPHTMELLRAAAA